MKVKGDAYNMNCMHEIFWTQFIVTLLGEGWVGGWCELVIVTLLGKGLVGWYRETESRQTDWLSDA